MERIFMALCLHPRDMLLYTAGMKEILIAPLPLERNWMGRGVPREMCLGLVQNRIQLDLFTRCASNAT